jgi:hypothetical protein
MFHTAAEFGDGARLAAFDADLAEEAGVGQAAAFASGQVGFPPVGIEGIAQQGGAVLLGGLVAGLDKPIGLGVIGAGEAADRDFDHHIGKFLRLLDVMHNPG